MTKACTEAGLRHDTLVPSHGRKKGGKPAEVRAY